MTTEVEIPSPTRLTARTWLEIKALYQGTAPEVADSRDCNAMRVCVLARRFCCHTNTIFAHAKLFNWKRPTWYTLKGSSHPKGARYRAGGEAETALLATLAAAADKPCPTNEDLATDLGTSSQFIMATLGRLRRARRLRVEHHGNGRRIKVVGVAGWTQWTNYRPPAPALSPPPVVPADTSEAWKAKGTSAMIRRRQQCHTMLRDAAEAGARCPSNVDLAAGIGCTKRTASHMVLELADAGAFAVEHRNTLRRVVFSDGAVTAWTSTQNRLAHNDGLTKWQRKLKRRAAMGHPASGKVITVRAPMVPGKVRDAQLALQRAGKTVFDRAVVLGGEKGRSWWADGHVVDADGLVAFAAKTLPSGAPP